MWSFLSAALAVFKVSVFATNGLFSIITLFTEQLVFIHWLPSILSEHEETEYCDSNGWFNIPVVDANVGGAVIYCGGLLGLFEVDLDIFVSKSGAGDCMAVDDNDDANLIEELMLD